MMLVTVLSNTVKASFRNITTTEVVGKSLGYFLLKHLHNNVKTNNNNN